MAEIAVGSIVSVVIDGWLHGYQGKVVEMHHDGHPDGPIGVEFPAFMSYLFNWEDRNIRIVRFEEGDLQLNEDWSVYTLTCRTLNRHMPTGESVPELPLDLYRYCQVKGCKCKVARRVCINVWGALYFFLMCSRHAEEHDGKWTEELPQLKQSRRQVAA